MQRMEIGVIASDEEVDVPIDAYAKRKWTSAWGKVAIS